MTTKVNFTEETKAMDIISKALEKLDDDARSRVINWSISAFKINTQMAVNPAITNPAVQTPGNPPLQPNVSGLNDIKSLWKEKSPKSNYHKFALLGYHLEYAKGMNEFEKKDLQQAWTETKEPLPSKDTLEFH